ncbi:MAG: desulfoferrodoxin [Acidimicrobiales bacterium]
MTTTAGARLKFDATTAEVIVTKGGAGEITIDAGVGDAVQLGKRYQDESTGIEVLVTKAGSGRLLCNGSAMEQQQPKKTKSAD